MSLDVFFTATIKKDNKRLKKRGADLRKLLQIVQQISSGMTLEEKYKDHPLQGPYSGARDCHIESDWVLIYAVVGKELRLIRTGSHTDLFK